MPDIRLAMRGFARCKECVDGLLFYAWRFWRCDQCGKVADPQPTHESSTQGAEK